MSEPTEAWVRGEQKRTKAIGRLTVAVFVLALAFGAETIALFNLAGSNDDLTGVVVAQRRRLTKVSDQNAELTDILNGRTAVIARIDETLGQVKCYLRKESAVVVAIVVALAEDTPESFNAVLAKNLELQDALDGICREDDQ